MPIRKYGTEPANTEVRPEDNDAETLRALGALGQQVVDDSKSEHRGREDRQSQSE